MCSLFFTSKVLEVLGLIISLYHQCQTSASLKGLNVVIRVKDDVHWWSGCSPHCEQLCRMVLLSVEHPLCCKSTAHVQIRSLTKSAVLPHKLAVLKTEQILFHLCDILICSVSQ